MALVSTGPATAVRKYRLYERYTKNMTASAANGIPKLKCCMAPRAIAPTPALNTKYGKLRVAISRQMCSALLFSVREMTVATGMVCAKK